MAQKKQRITTKFIAYRIKKARVSQKVSQKTLAGKLKYLNQAQVSKIETGARNAAATDLILIAAALGISVEDILAQL